MKKLSFNRDEWADPANSAMAVEPSLPEAPSAAATEVEPETFGAAPNILDVAPHISEHPRWLAVAWNVLLLLAGVALTAVVVLVLSDTNVSRHIGDVVFDNNHLIPFLALYYLSVGLACCTGLIYGLDRLMERTGWGSPIKLLRTQPPEKRAWIFVVFCVVLFAGYCWLAQAKPDLSLAKQTLPTRELAP